MLRPALSVFALLALAGCASAPPAPDSPPVSSAERAGQETIEVADGGYTEAERAQGYAERDGRVVFVFDPARYGFEAVGGAAVTGAFRAWSSDDADPAGALAPDGPVWTLAADPDALGPGAPFKFRADGRWLDPPADAPNAAGGNLVYRFGETPPRLVAELRGSRRDAPALDLLRTVGRLLAPGEAPPPFEGPPTTVWVSFEGVARPLDPMAYTVVRWDGERIPVAQVTPHEAHSALLVPALPLDPAQVHAVEAELPELQRTLIAPARFDGLWRDLATAAPLGAVWTPPTAVPAGQRGTEAERFGVASVRLFAPRADSVHLHLYGDRTGPAYATVRMDPEASGTWHVDQIDALGDWYDFSVFGPDGPGSAFANQTGETVSDPYALVSDDSWGRARIWHDAFAPPRPVAGGRPAMEDVVAYEVHVQDFTDRLPVADGVGPIEAFGMPGLTNARGEPVGVDFLERLGINTVHLMPMQEFLHYPDSLWRAAFAGDTLFQAQGIARENYQWGYRTTHAFAVESRFGSAGDERGRERERFRDLVDALHARGMAVLIDVVFNHTGENMDGAEQILTFNGIDKHYAYRLSADGRHIGAFGNEVKSENRPMMQRWLLDQLRHWVDVFGVDGFRIDLAGQTDEQTLRWIQAELGRDVLIYGEPWIGSNDPDYEANPDWDWYKADSPITFFQDEARNAFKGSPLDPPTPAAASRGFAGGDAAARDAALQGVANAYDEEPTPNAGINYLDIHDNWALADRFAACQTGACRWDGRGGVRDAEMRIGAALLLTSLGPVVIHGGTEIARSKGLAPLPEALGGELPLPLPGTGATIYLKGRGDTYNLRTANHFDWETVGNTDGPVDHAAMEAWWRELIALRLSDAGAVFRTAAPDAAQTVEAVRPEAPAALAYAVGGRVLVAVNSGAADAELDLAPLLGPPGARWSLVAESSATTAFADADGLGGSIESGAGPLRLGPASVRIWVRD